MQKCSSSHSLRFKFWLLRFLLSMSEIQADVVQCQNLLGSIHLHRPCSVPPSLPPHPTTCQGPCLLRTACSPTRVPHSRRLSWGRPGRQEPLKSHPKKTLQRSLFGGNYLGCLFHHKLFHFCDFTNDRYFLNRGTRSFCTQSLKYFHPSTAEEVLQPEYLIRNKLRKLSLLAHRGPLISICGSLVVRTLRTLHSMVHGP